MFQGKKNVFSDTTVDEIIKKRLRKWFISKLEESGRQKKNEPKQIKSVNYSMEPSTRASASNAGAADTDSSSTE